jgi:hypothetical protein
MSSPAEEAQVREATRRIIQGVDLETVKEKQIVEMVEAQLGILLGDDEALMRCLQEEIEKFLLDDTAEASPGKTKRITPKSQAGKRRRSLVKFEDDDDNEDPDDGDWDHTQEDEDEDFDEDDAAPKKRRDDMNAAREKWSEPAPAPSNTVPLTSAVAPAAAAPGAPVPEDKLLAALQLKGDDGATAKELAGFLKIGKSEVNKALYRLQSSGRVRSDGAGGGAPTWRVGSSSAPPAPAPAPAPAAPPVGASAGPPPPVAPQSQGAGAVEGQICALSRARRCTVSDFRGKKYVGLREYYEKDGVWLPGKKGISLPYEQWSQLRAKIGEVNQRIADFGAKKPISDATVCVLGRDRRVTVDIFNGSVMIGIREFYEKDGAKLPGKKGISLSKDQWELVTRHEDLIEAACGGQ